MKAILEFNLDDADDVNSHKLAIKSLDLALALWDISNYFRSQLKYNDDAYTKEQLETIEGISEEYYKLLDKYNIKLDDFIY